MSVIFNHKKMLSPLPTYWIRGWLKWLRPMSFLMVQDTSQGISMVHKHCLVYNIGMHPFNPECINFFLQRAHKYISMATLFHSLILLNPKPPSSLGQRSRSHFTLATECWKLLPVRVLFDKSESFKLLCDGCDHLNRASPVHSWILDCR